MAPYRHKIGLGYPRHAERRAEMNCCSVGGTDHSARPGASGILLNGPIRNLLRLGHPSAFSQSEETLCLHARRRDFDVGLVSFCACAIGPAPVTALAPER